MNSMNCEIAAEEAGLKADNLKELVKISRKAATKGGEVLRKYYGNISMIENKGREGDLVTNADLEAEKVILKYLSKKTSHISILAEESGSIGSNTGLQWYVDPLDGTTNFAHNYPFFATSIGLCWQGKPILGSICIPFLKEVYWGAPGIGAFCNKTQIHVSYCNSLKDSLLVTGFAYDRHVRLDNNYAEFCWLTHRTRGVRRGGAAAVDLAFVAAGRLDGYWERGLSAWDLAAGVAIVELAGGKINDYRNSEFNLNTGRVLACTPSLEEPLIKELENIPPLNGASFGAPEIKAIGS